MQFIEEFDIFSKLENPRRKWRSYGRTGKSEVVFLGDPARLTIGEKLLGKYTRFYQVYTGWNSQVITVDATSAVGEMQFHVTLNIACRIAEASAPDAIRDGFDLTESVVQPLSQVVRKAAKRFVPQDYKSFEDAVEAQITQEAGHISRTGPFEIGRVEVSVRRDENVADRDEFETLMSTLSARLAKATHDGNTEKATSLANTLQVMRDLQNNKHADTLNDARQAKDVQDAINDLLDTGMSSDHAIVAKIRNRQTENVRHGDDDAIGQHAVDRAEETKQITKATTQPKDMD